MKKEFTVLLVDDDHKDLELIERYIKESCEEDECSKCRIICTQSPLLAITLIGTERIDFAAIDYNFPYKDDIKALAEVIRKHHIRMTFLTDSKFEHIKSRIKGTRYCDVPVFEKNSLPLFLQYLREIMRQPITRQAITTAMAIITGLHKHS